MLCARAVWFTRNNSIRQVLKSENRIGSDQYVARSSPGGCARDMIVDDEWQKRINSGSWLELMR